MGLRRNAFGFNAPLRRFLATTLASVWCEIPWSCMYLLIFIPKNFVVTNCAELAVPRRARVQARIGAERAGEVLVHADRDAELVVAEPDRVGRERERARRGRAPVVDVGERDTGEPEQRDDRVGVVDLVTACERELDVAPLDARVGERAPDRDRAHVDRGHAGKAPERVQPHPNNRHIHAHAASTSGPRSPV